MSPTRNRGELESALMDVLWSSETALTAREIQERFTTHVPAITTIITVLDRMRLKGSVEREASGGRSHVFRAAHSRENQVAAVMTDALATARDQSAALMLFAGSLSADDRAFLSQALANPSHSASTS